MKHEGNQGKVLTNAGVWTVTKSDQVAVDANQAGEIVQFVVQPPIDVKLMSVFTEETW